MANPSVLYPQWRTAANTFYWFQTNGASVPYHAAECYYQARLEGRLEQDHSWPRAEVEALIEAVFDFADSNFLHGINGSTNKKSDKICKAYSILKAAMPK